MCVCGLPAHSIISLIEYIISIKNLAKDLVLKIRLELEFRTRIRTRIRFRISNY